MECFLIKSTGKKAAEIADDFKEDLNFFNCSIYDSIDDIGCHGIQENIPIFIITIQNTMNSYLNDLALKANTM